MKRVAVLLAITIVVLLASVVAVDARELHRRGPSLNTRIVAAVRDARGDRIRIDAELTANARARAGFMAHEGFDDHAGAGDVSASRWVRWGEIVAWRSSSRFTPGWAVAAWLASPTHRPVLLARRWTAVGASCAVSRMGRTYCVVVFGDDR